MKYQNFIVHCCMQASYRYHLYKYLYFAYRYWYSSATSVEFDLVLICRYSSATKAQTGTTSDTTILGTSGTSGYR